MHGLNTSNVSIRVETWRAKWNLGLSEMSMWWPQHAELRIRRFPDKLSIEFLQFPAVRQLHLVSYHVGCYFQSVSGFRTPTNLLVRFWHHFNDNFDISLYENGLDINNLQTKMSYASWKYREEILSTNDIMTWCTTANILLYAGVYSQTFGLGHKLLLNVDDVQLSVQCIGHCRVTGKKRILGDCRILIINVKKLQFIHMLTATDVRTSKTTKIKKLFYYNAAHRHTSMCSSIEK